MTDRRDPSTSNLQQALTRYMAEQKISRRDLLDRIAKVGSAVALAPVIAACASSTGSPAASAAAPTPAGSGAAPSAAPSAAAAASPEPELFVYNWADYIGEDVVPSFEEKYGVKVTYDFFDTYDTMYTRIGADGGGFDVAFPVSTDIPGFIERGLVRELDQSLLTNIGNLGAAWADPGYDRGNKYSVPYMWWTTGIAYDTEQITEELTSSEALWDPRWSGHIAMLDDYREVFAIALKRLGHSGNTTDEAELDAALALLQEQKPLVRTYTTDDIGVLSTGDAWIAHAWAADVYQVQVERPSVTYYVPEEGGVKGSDTMVVLSGAKHPVAAHLFINHLLDAEVSASNTNFIGYMGPNEAAKEFIDPTILEDPAVNPDQQIVARLEELLELGADDDKYVERWNTLRAGG
jgi:spermidine/putrescine transport system substrate-binding protein